MSDERRVVSDTGPLISLEKLPDGHRLIRTLYDSVLVPPAVLDELAHGLFESPDAYLDHYGIRSLVDVVAPPAEAPGVERLDRGERDAISLALDRGLPLLIEEEAGRTVSRQLGIPISGIAGQVLKARRRRLLTRADAERMLLVLFESGRINRRVYDGVGEAIRSS
ncbi:hypothetical protein [Rubrivirga sp.]|uniref:hypothetical protein n=1 Tax=Rubrivirga sp. TaxID=1885344 RepID=UPI003B51BF4B